MKSKQLIISIVCTLVTLNINTSDAQEATKELANLLYNSIAETEPDSKDACKKLNQDKLEDCLERGADIHTLDIKKNDGTTFELGFCITDQENISRQLSTIKEAIDGRNTLFDKRKVIDESVTNDPIVCVQLFMTSNEYELFGQDYQDDQETFLSVRKLKIPTQYLNEQ